MGQWDKTQYRELLGLFICVCSSLCTIVAHNTARNRPDNFPSCPLNNHHCSNDVYLRERGGTIRYNAISHKISWYDTIWCINATTNLMRSKTGVSSSMNVCCCSVAASLAITAGRRSQRNGQHGHMRRPFQTWSAGRQCWPATTRYRRQWRRRDWLTGRQLYAVAHDRRRCLSGAA